MAGLDFNKLKVNISKASIRIYVVGVLVVMFVVVLVGTIVALRLSFGSVVEQYDSSVKRNLQRVAYEFDSLDGRVNLSNFDAPKPDNSGIPLYKIPLEYINVMPGHVEDVKPLLGCSYAGMDAPQNRVCAGVLTNKALGAIAYVRGRFEKINDLVSPRYIDDPRTGDYFLVTLSARGTISQFIVTFDSVKRVGDTLTPYLSPAWSLTGFRIGSSTRRAYSREPQIKGRALKLSGQGAANRFEFIFQIPAYAFADDAFQANQAQGKATIWPPEDISDARLDIKLIGNNAVGESSIILDSTLSEPDTVFSFDKMRNYLTPGEVLVFSPRNSSTEIKVRHSTVENLGARRNFPFNLIDHLTDFFIKVIVPAKNIDALAQLPDGSSVAIRGDASSVLGGWRMAAQSIVLLSSLISIMLLVSYVILRVFVLDPLYKVRRNTLHMKERFSVVDEYRLPFHIKESQSEVGVLWRNILELHEALIAYGRSAVERSKREHQFLRAIGHEIRSPLQDLMLRHNDENDPSTRYVRRISFAVKYLYGASLGQEISDSFTFKTPQEAMNSLSGDITKENITEYLINAAESAIAGIKYVGSDKALYVMVDADMLESVLTAIINNANDFRVPDTEIVVDGYLERGSVVVTIKNIGPHIANDPIEEIFEYGVSVRNGAGEDEHLGQGLYMARTFVSRLSGSLTARNLGDGVCFEIRLPCVS
ncbi:sensor histidine kinase [Pseudomonas asiatica]|uniref:sensor histidine kinase n=1 Tax=Pseudomonas asiatica TaxID=2219225 RepID=UPI00383B0C10